MRFLLPASVVALWLNHAEHAAAFHPIISSSSISSTTPSQHTPTWRHSHPKNPNPSTSSSSSVQRHNPARHQRNIIIIMKRTSTSTTTSLALSSSSTTTTTSTTEEHLYRRRRPVYTPGACVEDPNYVRIFDTTLRDGEQSPGATLTSAEKLDIARLLAKLGVDIIEAGFPVASPDDLAAVQQIANTVGNLEASPEHEHQHHDAEEDRHYVPVICGLARAHPRDIEVAWQAVKAAKYPRVHTFIATSTIHMQTKLHKSPAQVLQTAVSAVQHAASLGCRDIEFSPEDAGRSDRDFLVEVLSAVIAAGATTLNIPDTTGWNMPWEFGELIAYLRHHVPGAENVVFSTHCQNDLGLATANSLAGAKIGGARQLECTINGIGERAGNASLEEIVMALKLKGASQFTTTTSTSTTSTPDSSSSSSSSSTLWTPTPPSSSSNHNHNFLWTAVNPVFITPTSKMVAEYTGMACQPHKAIVGANAFQHESGIHQDGMIKNAQTYEIMTPESIGLLRSSSSSSSSSSSDSFSSAGIVLGKHSGRNAVNTRLKELGYDLDADKLNAVFVRFKQVAEKKKGGLEDEDLEALVADQADSLAHLLWEVTGLQSTTGLSGIPTATVKMRGPDGLERYLASTGTGPVDAVYKAIDQILGVSVTLESYQLNSVTEGIEALAITRVMIAPRPDGPNDAPSLHAQGGSRNRKFSGTGSDTDIVTSSARAYISALNKMLKWNLRRREREREDIIAASSIDDETKDETTSTTSSSSSMDASGIGNAALAGVESIQFVSP